MKNASVPITALLYILLSFNLSGAADLVTDLQDSFDETPAGRKHIYTEVIAGVDRVPEGSRPVDYRLCLARAVAFNQRAMDSEDDYISSLIAAAPSFGRVGAGSPPFIADYREAARSFEALADSFPFVKPYAVNAHIISEHWGAGSALLQDALDLKTRYPYSRFWKRLLLLAGCSLARDRQWLAVRQAFDPLWKEAPGSGQAVDSYRLAWALKGPAALDIPPERMLDWGRSLGYSGRAAFTHLIETWPNTPQAEIAYLELARNISQGFAARSLSTNFELATRLDRYYREFEQKYPASRFLPDFLLVRADFLYQCGKKSMSIARKNDFSSSSKRKQVSRKYQTFADNYFDKVREIDGLMSQRFHATPDYYRVGILSALSRIEADHFDPALVRLHALAAENPDSESVNQVYWYIALADYLKLDYRAVVDNLKSLEKDSYRDPTYWSRAMLFLGKACLARGDTASAARVFSGLAQVYPYNYYGIRARYLKGGLRLAPPFAGAAGLTVVAPLSFPSEYSPAGAAVQAEAESWQRLGFYAEAAYIYNNALTVVPEDKLLRFRMHENLYRAGWYHRVLRGFRGPFREYLQRGGTGLPDDFWQIAYLNPEPFQKFIQKSGEKNHLPPALITAVIRQESNFHPRARSHAGARGLMQLLPTVARRLGRRAGYGNVTATGLFDPEVNIALGSRFLASNLAQYDGNITLAISCYNADPRNLPAWLERSHSERPENFDLDLFIELIPLDETYDYNLQVLTNFWRYQEVYGERENLFNWKLSSVKDR